MYVCVCINMYECVCVLGVFNNLLADINLCIMLVILRVQCDTLHHPFYHPLITCTEWLHSNPPQTGFQMIVIMELYVIPF